MPAEFPRLNAAADWLLSLSQGAAHDYLAGQPAVLAVLAALLLFDRLIRHSRGVYNSARALDLDFYNKQKIENALAVVKHARTQIRSPTPLTRRRYRILEAILSYALALHEDSPFRWRSAAREWLIVCLEVVLEEYSRPLRRGLQALRFWKRREDEFSREDIEALLEFLKEIAARERGESEPKEVFCVVRERR